MLGFTKQEQGIVIFLIFTFFVGSVVTLYDRYFSEIMIKEVNSDYIEEFKQRSEEIKSNKSVESNQSIEEANISAIDHNESGNQIAGSVSKYSFQVAQGNENTALDQKKKFLININEANQEELQMIPRVGPVLAEKIIYFRQKKGGFNSIEELQQVKGIGSATFNKIKHYISLN